MFFMFDVHVCIYPLFCARVGGGRVVLWCFDLIRFCFGMIRRDAIENVLIGVSMCMLSILFF